MISDTHSPLVARPRFRPVSVPCHFGEWLQGRLGRTGPLALVTLVPDRLHVVARWQPSSSPACHTIGHGAFPATAVQRLHRALDLPLRGRSLLRLPFAPGLGTGMSTASLLAHARLAGYDGPPSLLAQAMVTAEGASDPLMFDQPDQILWASRIGVSLGRLPAPFRAHLVAGFLGPPRPTRPTDQDYDDLSDLFAEWPRARSLAEQARLSSESARRCQNRRGPGTDPMAALARDLGALGWTASHSGPARALIFAPGTVHPGAADLLREAGLHGICHLATGRR